MTILDRTRGQRIRIDASQFADERARRLPALDRTRDQAAGAMHDAADQARHQLDRAAEIARIIRGDIAHSAEKVSADNPIDEIGQRIRAAASTTAVRALISRLEKELPEVDRDKYQRAYARGRAQARSRYLVVGLVAGVSAGAVAALLLDPKHGKARRDAIAHRTGSLTKSAGSTISGKARYASDRARGIAIERGLLKPSTVTPPPAPEPAPLVPVFADGPVTDPSSTVWEPLPDSRGQALPTHVTGETVAENAVAAEPADPAAEVQDEPALEAAGDRSVLPSTHG
jgi:hypothetical protein